ncbi:hypothetical protein D3C87_1492640 [compost metagenome]
MQLHTFRLAHEAGLLVKQNMPEIPIFPVIHHAWVNEASFVEECEYLYRVAIVLRLHLCAAYDSALSMRTSSHRRGMARGNLYTATFPAIREMP